MFYTIIPISFVVYIPLDILKEFEIFKFIVIILFAIFVVFIAFFMFYKGLKKYSSGNLMSARV